MFDYSATSSHKLQQPLIDELLIAINSVKPYGSIEVYVQDNVVTQITIRKIKKTSVRTQNLATSLNGERQI